MGCDIHPAIEYRQSPEQPWKALLNKNPYFGKYGDEKEFTARLDIGRDYDLFAVLGNVRNGSGFAGCDTGDGFDSISDNRGVPDDISDEAREALSDEHSATWVTLAEILAFDWDRSTKHRGWVNGIEFEKWDRMKQWNPQPESWCGGVSGGNVEHISEQEMRAKVTGIMGKDARGADWEKLIEQLKAQLASTYCLIEWENSYTADTTQMWTKILPKMLNLGRQYGFDNVRLVMDFDS